MASGASSSAAADRAYVLDHRKLEELRTVKPWKKDPKYFKKAKISAAATMKMTTHAATGVEKGLSSASGMPIEVMGLLIGHLDTDDSTNFIITDACPLPVEGTETTVMADNSDVQTYMISLAESLERTREERFIGWYHSHPFDVGAHSNAFLSATDVSTQLSWQFQEDQSGHGWLALVVDPLRGVAKGKPEIGAFRCYPPTYTPPKGLAPDGVVWSDEKERNARWGESCISYYQLETEYFVPTLAASLLSILARDFLWTRVLSSTPMLESEARDRVSDRLRAVTKKVDAAASSVKTATISTVKSQALSGAPKSGARADLAEAVAGATDLAVEVCRGHAAQLLKDLVFNARTAVERKRALAGAAATGLEGGAGSHAGHMHAGAVGGGAASCGHGDSAAASTGDGDALMTAAPKPVAASTSATASGAPMEQ